MRRIALPALAADRKDGGALLRTPKVGVWSRPPADGTLVEPGSLLGTLTQTRRHYDLIVPEGVSGRIRIESHDVMPVGYGETLVEVVPFSTLAAKTKPRAAGAAADGQRGTAVLAPTDGVFYRASGAGAKPYVSVGDRVVAGQPVGLIEVMKTFNPIAYGGAGFPEDAEIVEILVGDEAEVRAGQPLLIIKKR
jgi:biotin carboxyl carrier protein